MTKKIIKYIIFSLLVLTPIFGLYEYFASLSGNGEGIYLNQVYSPWWIKGLKDFGLLFIFIFFVLGVLMKEIKFKIPKIFSFWLFIFFILISFILTAGYVSLPISLVGLRVFAPFFLFLVAYNIFDNKDIKKISKILIFVALIECVLATIELFLGAPIHGKNFLGLSARPSGTFFVPSSFAIFLCVVIVLILSDKKISSKKRFLLIALFSIFIILSESGTGIIGLSLIFILWFLFFAPVNNLLKISVFLIILIIPVFIFLNLPEITGRADIFYSLEARGQILSILYNNMNYKDIFLGKGLGVGTNSTITILKSDQIPIEFNENDLAFISDSQYTSLLSQAGVFSLIFFLTFNIALFLKAFKKIRYDYSRLILILIPLILIFSFTSNIFELFPVNWIYFIFLGTFFKFKFYKPQSYENCY